MNIKDWTYQSANIQGDVNIHLEKGRIVGDFMEINVFVFSDKWRKVDISLEYQNQYTKEWHSDMILLTDCEFIDKNKLFGLSASSDGEMSTIIWNFKKSNLQQGNSIKIRTKVLPRIFYSSMANNCNILTYGYDRNKIDIDNNTNNYFVLGLNNNGDYIATDSDRIFILNEFDGRPNSILNSWEGVDNPSCAIQIYNGNYIIADTDNNRIIELDENLDNILQTYSVNQPVFIDYDEENSNLLISEINSNSVFEINWDLNNGGNYLVWTYPNFLSNPTCATYAFNNKDEIVISNSNNNQVIIYDKTTNNKKYISYGKFKDDISDFEARINLNTPIRAYKLQDNNILIIEKSGVKLDFNSITNGSGAFILGEDAII
jgi:hypothetical protein